MIVAINILREALQIRQALSHLKNAGIKDVCAFKKEFHITHTDHEFIVCGRLALNSGCP